MSAKIKVVGADLRCFAADAVTLEPISASFYDPWAFSDPDPAYAETVAYGDWCNRLNQKRQDQRNAG